jgi:hypothetical protein
MKNGFFTLAEAALKFKAFEENLKYANEAILAEWAMTVRDRAREAIGTYRYKWPQLADATQHEREQEGFAPNEPLLRTGELRDSISAMVEMHGPDRGRAVVGSDSDIAVWQELGTRSIPPRSFLAASAMRSERDLEKIARKFVRAAWHSASHDNEILHLLHAIKAALEIAHKGYHIAEKVLKK